MAELHEALRDLLLSLAYVLFGAAKAGLWPLDGPAVASAAGVLLIAG